MSDLTPFTSVFTSAGLLLEAGAKVTMGILNKVVRNTGFNWMGGRHPMRESIGVLDVPHTDLEENNDSELYGAAEIEVMLSSRFSGVVQFTSENSYEVICVLEGGRDISYNVARDDHDDLEAIIRIDSNYYDLVSITVVKREHDRFTVRLDIPQPFLPIPTTYTIAWLAKGY